MTNQVMYSIRVFRHKLEDGEQQSSDVLSIAYSIVASS
jgi:hypothetical protein